MSEAKRITEGLHYDPLLYEELIAILKNLDGTDSDFMFGVSDTYFFPESPPPYSIKSFALPNKCFFKLLPAKDNLNYYKLRFADRQNVIKLLLPDGYPFFDAMIWKLYAYNNSIWNLFKAIKDHPIVLVGPAHYKNFDQLANLSDYHHIEIHGSKASLDRELIMQTVIQKHRALSGKQKPPVYLFVAGSISVYWVYHLHQKLTRKYLIDVGQALNFLFEKKGNLMHREFGYSEVTEKGRKPYNAKQLYGDRAFRSSMKIENGQVHFDLQLKWSDVWQEKLLTNMSKNIVNLYTIKRSLLQARHNLYRLFRN